MGNKILRFYRVASCCEIIALLLFVSISYGADNIKTEKEIQKIDPKKVEKEKIERKTGSVVPEEKPLEIEEKPQAEKKEIIIKKYRPKNLFIETKLKVEEKKTETPHKETEPQKELPHKQNPSSPKKLTGYCSPEREYQVSLYPVPATFRCLLNEQPKTLKGKLTPKVNNYFLGLTSPEIEGCRELKKEITIAKTKDYSPNLASSIDKKVIENALLKATTKTAGEVASGIKERLEPEKKTTILLDGLVPVVVEEKKDNWREFQAGIPYMAGANLTEALASEILATYGRIPPIFYVDRNEMYYVEAEAICD